MVKLERGKINIDYKDPLTLAKITSFLGIVCLFINFFFFLILNSSPMAPKEFIAGVGLFSFLGVLTSSILCRFFLPSIEAGEAAGPVISKKPLFLSFVFIGLIIIPNIILRSLGADAFFGSFPVRAIASVLSGMLYPVCFGLFFLTHKQSRLYTFLFSIAIALGYLSFFFSYPVLKNLMHLTFNMIKWIKIFIGIFVGLCCFFFSKTSISIACPIEPDGTGISKKTNWSLVFRLIGLASVLKILHAVTDMHLMPGVRYSAATFHPYFLVVGLALPVFSFFAGRNIERFIKLMIPPAICLLILLPCLPLFEDYKGFVFIINILVGFFHFMFWIVFTAALVENYKGGIWYYSIVSAVYLTSFFSFSGIIGRHIPAGTEFSVLFAGIAAIVFFVLSFRILFSKNTLSPIFSAASSSKNQSIEDIFIAHKLSDREIDVAHLLLKPGCLEAKGIGELLFISPTTVKTHLTNIYRKFNVSKRSEFMALFIQRNDTDLIKF